MCVCRVFSLFQATSTRSYAIEAHSNLDTAEYQVTRVFVTPIMKFAAVIFPFMHAGNGCLLAPT